MIHQLYEIFVFLKKSVIHQIHSSTHFCCQIYSFFIFFERIVITDSHCLFLFHSPCKMKAVNIQGSLYHACRSNDREFVRTLLFSRSDELDVLYDTPTPPVTIQLSPMYVACAGGHQKIVEMLLRHPSAKVRSNSQRYTRFLSMAAESGRSGVVRLLLKYALLRFFCCIY